jgi:CDP-diacylglycerol pyrophosphatase
MTTGVRAVALSALIVALAAIALVVRHRRDALRRIVQNQCLPHYHQRHDPTPSDRLILPSDQQEADGYAVLHDIKGGVHELLIPIRTLSGIESPVLLDARTPDYIAAAWQNRDALDALAGRALTHDEVGLAVNPHTARGQDQFHIHMECLGTALRQFLNHQAGAITLAWTPLKLNGHTFQVRRVTGGTLADAQIIRQVANEIPDGPLNLGTYTLIIAGHTFAAEPGFVLLMASGSFPGEKLLDARCAR